MKKLSQNKKELIKLIAWALTIVILLPSMIVIGVYTFYPFDTPSGEIPNPAEEPLVYGQHVHNAFKTSLDSFFRTGIFPLGDATITQMTGFFLTAFSRARIPEEKVLAFGQHLKNNSNQVFPYILKLIDYLDTEASEPTLKEGVHATVFFNELTIISSALLELLNTSGFTEDEIGKVLYEALFQIQDIEYHNALLQLGKNGFTTIYKSIYALLSLNKIDLASGYTDADLRQIRSAFYQIGDDYISLYSTLGDAAIETVIGTTFLALPEGIAEIDANHIAIYNQAIQSLQGLVSFSLLVFSEFSINISNEFYINSTKYAEQNLQEYLILATLQGARSAKVALQAAYNNTANDKIKNEQALLSAYANAYKESFNLTAILNGEGEYDIDHTQDIKEYIDNIYDLANNYRDIITLENVQALTPQEQDVLLAKIALLSQVDEQVLAVPSDLAGVLLVNIFFKIIDLQGFLQRMAEKQLLEELG